MTAKLKRIPFVYQTIQMGFDMMIELHLSMCPTNGKPYAWKDSDKVYVDLNDYIIPEEYRKWIQLRGSHLYAYIQWCDESTTSCEIAYFLEFFPEWEEVDEHDWWTEEDHRAFKATLEYLIQRPGYVISWSY